MFDWLAQEILTIKTKRFHIVDWSAENALNTEVEESETLPRSYKEFVHQFGNAKLFKKMGYYIIGVLAAPVAEQTRDGEKLYRFGHYQASNAYFKAAILQGEEESAVFEGDEGKLVQVASGFEKWLVKRCKVARSKYSKQQWNEVITGPSPFTTEEHKILDARRLFTCREVGVTPDGKILLEVHNGSETTIPFLSLGVQWKDNNLQGGIWIPVSHIRPGQTAIVEHESYRKAANLSEFEVHMPADPEPEDRERYWEFKCTRTTNGNLTNQFG